jgi:hypothetical protein
MDKHVDLKKEDLEEEEVYMVLSFSYFKQYRLQFFLIQSAAKAIKNASFLLICAGAGCSADSGLATYK